MPKAYDRQQLTITHDPTERFDLSIGHLPSFDPTVFFRSMVDLMTESIVEVIENLTGVDISVVLPDIEPIFDALSTLFGDLNPLSGEFDPQAAVAAFINLMVSVGESLPLSLIQELAGFSDGSPILDQLVDAITGSSGGLGSLSEFFDDFPDQIDAGKLFGRARSSVLPNVFLGAIGDFAPNLLEDPLFDWSGSVEDPLGEWVVDTAVRHVDPLRPETEQGNSVRVIPDGVTRDLLSDPEMPVTPGQRVPMAIHVFWQGLVSTADPIRLVVNGYDANNAEVLDTVIASAGNALPADSIDHPDADDDGWVSLSATFVVPSSPAVTNIRKTLRVTQDATAGTGVWFSDASQTKIQKLAESFTEGLAEKLVGFTPGGLFDGGHIIGTVGQNIVENLTDDLTSLDNAATDAFNDIRDGWRKLITGLRGTDPGPAPAVTEVETAAATTSDGLATNQAATVSLSESLNIPRAVPSYVGYGTDDVSFHHTLIDGVSTPTLGLIVLCPIMVQQDKVWEAIKFGIDATTMTTFNIALYSGDQATGVLTKILDLGDCKSQLDTAFDQQVVPLPFPISVQRRSLYYIGFLQIGGTAAPMHRWSQSFNWSTGLYPRWIGNLYNLSGQASFPDTIEPSDVGAGTKYFAAMGDLTNYAVAPGGKVYVDNFNRANASNLGANWTLRSGAAARIESNKLSHGSGSVGGYQTYIGRLDSVNQSVKIRVTERTDFQGNNWSGYRLGLRGDGLGRAVVMQFGGKSADSTGSGLSIWTCQTYAQCVPYNNGVKRAGDGSVFAGDVLEFQAIGDQYRIFRNGVEAFLWVDSGSVYPVTATCTEVGIGSKYDQNTLLADDWEAKDL